MTRTQLLQETKKMRFEAIYRDWNLGELTQEEAANMLGVSDRTFRRYLVRYEEDGLSGLEDKRIMQASHRCAPVDEVCALESMYEKRFTGWNVKL